MEMVLFIQWMIVFFTPGTCCTQLPIPQISLFGSLESGGSHHVTHLSKNVGQLLGPISQIGGPTCFAAAKTPGVSSENLIFITKLRLREEMKQ